MNSWKKVLPLAASLAITLTGCGTGPGPDLNGPEGAGYLAAFSGHWVLVPEESANMETKMRDSMGPRSRVTTGNMPGGGGRGGGVTGGRPPGGMTGGRGGGMAGRPSGGGMPRGGQRDPEAMQRTMETVRFLARTPPRFTLEMRPETVTLIQGEAAEYTLPLNGDERVFSQGRIELSATSEWTDEGLVIERVGAAGGSVKDKMNVDAEGHLVLEREIDTGRGKVEGILVYRRARR